MQFSLKSDIAYKKTITNIAFMTSVFAVGCILFGYFFLPLASAFYAALLFYETRGKKILSVIIPIITFAVNFLSDFFSKEGAYSPEGIAYVFIGLLLYFLLGKGVSKNETVFWLSVAILIFMALSAISIAFALKQSDGFSGFANLYERFKVEFVDVLTSLATVDENGNKVSAYNSVEAEIMLRELMIMAIPLVILTAIILCAVTLKIFSGLILRNSGEESGIAEWIFKPANTVAYFYITVAVLSLFAAADGSVFSYVLLSLDMIFAPIFAYMGAAIIHAFLISRGKSSFFAIMVIIVACVLLYAISFRLLSFIGVYFTVIANKISK